MKKNKFILFLLVFLSFSIENNIYAKNSEKFAVKEEGKIELEADEIEYLKAKQKFILKGNVFINKENIQMYSDSMIITYSENKKTKQMEIEIIEADKYVKVVNDTIVITGEKAIYNLKKNEIIFIKNVELTDKDSVTTGDKIIYDLTTKNINILGKKNEDPLKTKEKQRVKIVINDIKKIQDKYK